MIILITDALLGGENIKSLDTKKLMVNTIEKSQRYWKNTICEYNEELYGSLSKLLVYATATGGWDLKPLDGPLTDDSKRFLNQYSKTEMQEHFFDLLGNDEVNNIILMPLEPDPIGEYFVLWFLSEHIYHTDYRELITLLWSKPMEFAYFLSRCVSSYMYQSLFDTLIYGDYGIIINDTIPVLSSMLYVNLSAYQPLDMAIKTMDLLRSLHETHPENQELAIEYAKGLVNLSAKQEANDTRRTFEQLRLLFENYFDLSEFFE